MKAIIPVAGAGTNLRPLTYTQPKPLIPVAGKPIMAFIIDQLKSVGIDDFVFIIGYLGEKIKLYVETNYPELKTTFVYQEERNGLGHAIWTAKEAMQDAKEIFIVLGDVIFDIDLQKMLDEPNSCLAVKRVDNPREFGIVEYNANGFVNRAVEKPRIPKSNIAMVGLYKIKEVQALIDAIDFNIKNDIRTMKEFQLTDGLMRMIENGVQFSTLPVNNWFDCGKKEILLETNTMLLDKKGYASANLPPYDNTIIINPVSIGKGCELRNSIIGPYVTIGHNVSVNHSIIKNSIIGNYVGIEEIVLKQSIIGNDTSIKGLSQSLNIGDNTEIDFS